MHKAILQPGVAGVDAAGELGEQQAAAAAAGEDLAGKQQVDHTRNTNRNFFAELLLFAYRVVRSAPSVARGEGGFISKEYVGGFLNAAGAATFGAAIVGVTAAVDWTPQVVDFLLSNLDQFEAYCAVAFEHAPGAAQLLRWLEANAARKPNGERRWRVARGPNTAPRSF